MQHYAESIENENVSRYAFLSSMDLLSTSMISHLYINSNYHGRLLTELFWDATSKQFEPQHTSFDQVIMKVLNFAFFHYYGA